MPPTSHSTDGPDDRELELEPYPAAGPSSQPLLNGRPSSPPSRHKRRRSSGHGRSRAILYRCWKPLAAITAPILLLLVYSLIHPHFPGLPALPKIKIDTGDESRLGWADGVQGGTYGGQSCVCGHTEEGKRLCDIYGEEGLMRSRLVEGSGARMRRMLSKAREGNVLKIGVLGGSVSACHGLHPTAEYPQGDPAGPGCYPTLVRSWFVQTFPHLDVQLSNGAIGGLDSSYYAFCGTHHMDPDPDLIILDFDVNDTVDDIYQAFYDQLLRVLLEFKSGPAIVILGTWAPQVAQDVGYGDPQIIHLPVAHYYDVPYISMKRVMFHTYLRFPQSTVKAFYQPDILHPNVRGHRILADLLAAYFELELCQLAHYGLPEAPPTEATISTPKPFSSAVEIKFPLISPHLESPSNLLLERAEMSDLDIQLQLLTENRHFLLPTTPYSIPPVGLFTPLRDIINPTIPDLSTPSRLFNLVQPNLFCADANDRANPLRPTTSDGWARYEWNGEKHYWVSNTAGARIRVEITVSAGRVAVYYFRSRQYNLGNAKCWVDDNEAGAVVLPGWWDKAYNTGEVAYIDEKVTPGDHYVTCEIMTSATHPTNPEARNWRLIAVMAT